MEQFNPDGQATLDELRICFDGYNIYILDIGTITELVVVVEPNGNVYATFDKIDDNDGTPDVYQVYDTNYDNVKFAEVARLWGDTITKIQGGNN